MQKYGLHLLPWGVGLSHLQILKSPAVRRLSIKRRTMLIGTTVYGVFTAAGGHESENLKTFSPLKSASRAVMMLPAERVVQWSKSQ